MTNPPPTKSHNNPDPTPPAAQTPGHDNSGGVSLGARQGVLSVLPFTVLTEAEARADRRRPVAWLHITAPKDEAPTATSVCACGRNRRVTGQADVLALQESHTAHRDSCPLRTPTEGRAAA